MAAYAALISLANTIQQIPSFGPNSNPQIKSLHEKITILQKFMEDASWNSSEANIKGLEQKIRDAAHEAEDIIESLISTDNITICYEDLQKLVEEIDSIKEEVTAAVDTASRPSTRSRNNIVGFDEDMLQIKDQLTRGQSDLQIIPIVGMGGIGKTTLAEKVYDDPLVSGHFDIHAWATVSQSHELRRILLDLLCGPKNHGHHEALSDEKLRGLLYQSLKGRRYLIVMDDMWKGEIWDELSRCFPNDKNGSRILVTTRLANVANSINPSGLHHQMHFLSKDESWKLLCKVFAGDFAPELKAIAKNISEKCRGHPLAICVIGGLLQKEEKEAHIWERILKDVSSYANTDDEQCSEKLLLSYKHLPQHLKPCFLYMGLFPEDHKIRIKKLIRLWAAEGFLKPVQFRSSEEVAKAYLKDLIDRNLVSICERGSTGEMRSCNIHDLLRDLCLRICQVEKFFHILNERYLNDKLEEDLGTQRRLVIHATWRCAGTDDIFKHIRSLPNKYLSHVHSFIFMCCSFPSFRGAVGFVSLRLLRIFDAGLDLLFEQFPEEILQLVHLRYLSIFISSDIPSSITLLQYLQTMIVFRKWKSTQPFCTPCEIFEMPQLRHLCVDYGFLPDEGKELCHLETLSGLLDLKWSDEMIKRFPNLKKLDIWYSSEYGSDVSWASFGLHNLVHFHKLQSLSIKCLESWFSRTNEQWITFPSTLKKLSLALLEIPSDDHMAIIGSLPNLEVLKFRRCYFKNNIWAPIEGEFSRLKFLKFMDFDLLEWKANSVHFPSLEHLIIERSGGLFEEIPLGIGDIPTLEVIELIDCSSFLVNSAKKIQEEQGELGNDQPRIIIRNQFVSSSGFYTENQE